MDVLILARSIQYVSFGAAESVDYGDGRGRNKKVMFTYFEGDVVGEFRVARVLR